MPENYYQIPNHKGNIFVCRTQAGFAQALRKFAEPDEDSFSSIKDKLTNAPSEYPCLVIFNWAYNGYSYVDCTSIRINKLKDIIEQDNKDNESLLALTKSDLIDDNELIIKK